MRPRERAIYIVFAIGVVATGCTTEQTPNLAKRDNAVITAKKFGPGYNVHLRDELLFEPVQAGADADQGRALFGVAADLQTEDPTGALFEGFSIVANAVIESNGRSCFTCHRGTDVNFGLPAPPLSASVPLTDPLFTGIEADAQGDPDGMTNLDNLGLFKYRPNRFNQARAADDPVRQVLFWRKSPALLNIGFHRGLLNDGRGRVMLETDRGAVFSHTQVGDTRFDDLFGAQDADDLFAFQVTLVTDPALLALRDPSHPMHDTLANDPFATVAAVSMAQKRGQKVFERYCFVCHDAPNVFNHRASVEILGTDGAVPGDPNFAPHVSRTFNIGVSERNKHNLRFTHHAGGEDFEPVVLPLANEDGSINMHTVTFDIGLAATTGRTVDIGRFRVPQLRNVRNLAPYFHDNSAATLEEVVDYFNSADYNNSVDGSRFPVQLTAGEKADLLEFLEIL
jgi:hypothetical protein